MNFFGRKNQQQALETTLEDKLTEQQVAPGTKLHYDGELIGRLRSHHNALLDLTMRARKTAQALKFDETKKCVHNLRLLLNAHLLEKNLRLYTYLSCCLNADPAGLELTRDIRRETGCISRKAAAFTTHYNDAGINEGTRNAFLLELAEISGALNENFAREERSLYPMYQPPQAYADGAVKPLSTDLSPELADTSVGPRRVLPTAPLNMDDVVAMSPRDFVPRRHILA